MSEHASHVPTAGTAISQSCALGPVDTSVSDPCLVGPASADQTLGQDSWIVDYWRDPMFRHLFSSAGELIQHPSVVCNRVSRGRVMQVPDGRVEEVVFFAHISQYGRHGGEEATLNAVTDFYIFHQMRLLVSTYVKTCTCCFSNGNSEV